MVLYLVFNIIYFLSLRFSEYQSGKMSLEEDNMLNFLQYTYIYICTYTFYFFSSTLQQ